jgi:sodium-dependent dicarboxylate transporter 2/3/5
MVDDTGSVEASEDVGKLTPAEEQFERWRQSIGLFLGPAVGAVLYLALAQTLHGPARILASVLGWVVAWWVTEPVPIPITALLGACLCVLLGVAPAKEVFAPFAEPTIFLFLGSFILAESMKVHRLDRRFAFTMLSPRWVGASPGRILLVFGAITAILSMWISNTATAAMMYPIGLGVISALGFGIRGEGGPGRFATGMMLMAAYAASVGGIGTPVGTPPNLIGVAMIEKFTGTKIPFFQWMLFAVPLLVVMYLALFGLLYLMHRPGSTRGASGATWVREELEALGPWSRGEKNTLAAFLVAVSLWVVPGFLALVWGSGADISKSFGERVPEAVAALAGASLLFLLPVDWGRRKFTIGWRQAVRIDWGTLLLFGGGLSLGNLMFKTGVAEALGKGLLGISGVTSVWGITFAAIALAVVVSEATSNTAAANMVIPVVISLAAASGVDPVPPAIGATLGASWGFMLPVSTPPNAIVYGSGLVPVTRMIRAGFLFDIIGIGLLWAGLRVLLPLVGLAH